MSGLAMHQVYVIIIKSGAGKEGAVGVECGTGDRGRAIMMQEARVGLERGEMGAVSVECFDFVAVCAPVVQERLIEKVDQGGKNSI